MLSSRMGTESYFVHLVKSRESSGTPVVVSLPDLATLSLVLSGKNLTSKFSGIGTRGHGGGDTGRVKGVGEANAVTDSNPAGAGDLLSLVGELLSDGLETGFG